MSRFSVLRRAIRDFLLTVHPRVVFQSDGPPVDLPCLVFDLPNSYDDGDIEVFVLDVDGWDDDPDTTALEAMMAAVDGDGDPTNPTGLHRRVLAPEGLRAAVFRENRLSLTDDDPRIRRRKYTYQVRVFEG